MATAALLAAPPLPLQTRVSLEEYLSSAYEPDCDFVDGQLEERHLGERDHSTLQAALCAWFFQRRKDWRIVVMAEQRTRVSQTRVRLPDVCLVANDAPYEPVTATPPLLAVEILSPEDRLPRVLRRLDDFLAMGIPAVWLIDPAERALFTYTTQGLKLVTDARVELAGTPIYLDLPELFSALDS